MTCLKVTESQNGQIYAEDTFSHGAAHIYIYISLNLSFSFLIVPSFLYNIKMLKHKRIYHVKKVFTNAYS